LAALRIRLVPSDEEYAAWQKAKRDMRVAINKVLTGDRRFGPDEEEHPNA
jgi:hypothetical protein